jgi:hypothetical protein
MVPAKGSSKLGEKFTPLLNLPGRSVSAMAISKTKGTSLIWSATF